MPQDNKIFITILLFISLIGCNHPSSPIEINTYEINDNSKKDIIQTFAAIGLTGNLEEIITYKDKKELLLEIKGVGLIQKKHITSNNDIRHDYINIDTDKNNQPPIHVFIDCKKTFAQTDADEKLEILDGCETTIKINTSKNKEFPTFITFNYPKKEFKHIKIIIPYRLIQDIKNSKEENNTLYADYSKTKPIQQKAH